MKPLTYNDARISIEVRLCDWLYRAISRDCQVLDYAANYF